MSLAITFPAFDRKLVDVDPMYEPIYMHFREKKFFEFEQNARDQIDLYNKVISELATNFTVYVRTTPFITNDPDTLQWVVSVRFSIGDPKITGSKPGVRIWGETK